MSWVDADFKVRLRDTILGPASRSPDFFRPEAYRPIVYAFCEDGSLSSISREGLYGRAIMFLAVQLANEQVGA